MEIGERLKEAREAKGLSLENLQETTKIQKRYLTAIEEGNLHVLPGKFYARAFIKEYAHAVDLNPDEFLEEHKSEVPSTEDEETVQYTRMQRSNKENRRERNPASFSFIPTVIVVLLVIAIFFAGWIFLQKSTSTSSTDNSAEQQGEDEIIYNSDEDEEDEGGSADDKEQADDDSDAEDESDSDKDSESDEDKSKEPEFSIVEEGSGNSPESTYDLNNLKEEVNVELKASGDSYLEIKGDSGETYFSGMITSDQSPDDLDVSDEEKVHFNVGNASALTVKINGAEIEYPADPEDIVHQKIWVNLNKEKE